MIMRRHMPRHPAEIRVRGIRLNRQNHENHFSDNVLAWPERRRQDADQEAVHGVRDSEEGVGIFDLVVIRPPDDNQRVGGAVPAWPRIGVPKSASEACLVHMDGAFKHGRVDIRPAFNIVPEFGMLVLQSRHGLSLGATGKAVRGRPGWMRFCGLGIADRVPEANTLRDFREALIKAGELDALSAELERMIYAAGFISRSGRMLDSSPVAAPRQRAGAAEKAAIKEGQTAREIRPGEPAKAARKDTDARWTVQGCGRAGLMPPTSGARCGAAPRASRPRRPTDTIGGCGPRPGTSSPTGRAARG